MIYNRVKVIKYKQDYSYPIEDNILIDSDANYNQSLLERDTDQLWISSKDNSQLIKWLIIGGGIAIGSFLVLQIFRNKPG